MNQREREERARLSKKWATRRATLKEMRRCMELDRKARRDLCTTESWVQEGAAR